jgi:hypothetical protein
MQDNSSRKTKRSQDPRSTPTTPNNHDMTTTTTTTENDMHAYSQTNSNENGSVHISTNNTTKKDMQSQVCPDEKCRQKKEK